MNVEWYGLGLGVTGIGGIGLGGSSWRVSGVYVRRG